MNVRLGFNRLFIVAWVLWVLVVVSWSMNLVARDRAAFDDLIYEGEHGRSLDPKYRATEGELAEWRRRREESTFWTLTREVVTTRDGLRTLALVFLVLPTIIYAVLFATGWTVGWVYRSIEAFVVIECALPPASSDPRGPKGK